jgi:hypothetical protein
MQAPRPVEPGEQVDPDTVRLQRSADFDFTGSYRVLSGSKAAPVLVGVLVPEQGLRAKQCVAKGPSFVQVAAAPPLATDRRPGPLGSARPGRATVHRGRAGGRCMSREPSFDGDRYSHLGHSGSAEPPPEPTPLKPPRISVAFPTDALPSWARDWVRAEATATQTPEDLAGTCALCVLAACAGGRIEVEARTGWREPTNLYGLPVMPPSRGSRPSSPRRRAPSAGLRRNSPSR